MKISGSLDLCGPTLIEGWLYSQAWQSAPINLQVYIADRLIGECLANRFRQDLRDAGFGDGNCGFSFSVPEDLCITDFRATRLRLVDTPVYLLPNDFTSIAMSPDIDPAADLGTGLGIVTRAADLSAPHPAFPAPAYGKKPALPVRRDAYFRP